MRDRGEAARKALGPGGAAQAGGCDTDDRAGDGDAALAQDDRGGDDALRPQAGQRQQIDQPQEDATHALMVEEI
jgi:hypothetical protein